MHPSAWYIKCANAFERSISSSPDDFCKNASAFCSMRSMNRYCAQTMWRETIWKKIIALLEHVKAVAFGLFLSTPREMSETNGNSVIFRWFVFTRTKSSVCTFWDSSEQNLGDFNFVSTVARNENPIYSFPKITPKLLQTGSDESCSNAGGMRNIFSLWMVSRKTFSIFIWIFLPFRLSLPRKYCVWARVFSLSNTTT